MLPGTLRPQLPGGHLRRLRAPWAPRRGRCAPRARAKLPAAVALLPFLTAPPFFAAAPSEHSEADARRAEEQLQAVKAEIERVTREVSAEQVERDRLTRALRGAELAVAHARDSLAEVRHERAEDAVLSDAPATEKR